MGVQTNAYLERLLLQRAHHAGVTVGQHFDADNAISILATYGYNSNEVEHKIDDLVGYANSKCPDRYVDTVESLHFTPSAKNIEAYNQFINDNYYDLYDYDMEDIDMMTNNAIFCDDGFGDAQASDFDGFFDEFEPVSFESAQESPSTDFEDLFDDWTDDFEYEAEDICVEDADTFDEFAAALVV